MTVLDLIKAALRLIGAIASSETPTAGQAQDAREALNLLLTEWHNDPLIALTEQQTFNVSSGTYSYTIGSGQTWNGNKPLKILSAYITDNGSDTPLRVINEVEYMGINDKDASGQPDYLFYDEGNTTGVVYLWPAPNDTFTCTILSQAAFTSYTSNSTTISLPNGYLQALKYNLAIEIAPEYEAQPSQWLVKRAMDTLAAIKRTNLKKTSRMRFDRALSTTRNTGHFDYRTYNFV